MFRYKLRTLLILLAVGPPLLAVPVIVRRAAEKMRRANELRQSEIQMKNERGPYYIKSS